MSPSAATPAYLVYIPPRDADFQEIWSYLRDGLERIMTLMPGEGISFTAYTNLYTTTFNNFWPSERGTSDLCSELYDNIYAHFAVHLEHIKQNSKSLHGVDLLHYYSEHWERYTRNASYADRVFTSVNRFWVTRQKDEQKLACPVYTLALMQWKRCIFMPVKRKLINAMLGLIMWDRFGAQIDQALVKTVVDSLVSLGHDYYETTNKECLFVYDDFKKVFMINTERYYEKESERILAKSSISEYLTKVEDRLREEEDRVGRYLHPSTRPCLIDLCERVLIREHADVIRDSFRLLLDGDKYDDLRRMHALLSRIPEELGPLTKRFETHIKQAAALLKIQRENSGDARFLPSLDDEAHQEPANHRAETGASSSASVESSLFVDDLSACSVVGSDDSVEEDYVVV